MKKEDYNNMKKQMKTKWDVLSIIRPVEVVLKERCVILVIVEPGFVVCRR